MSAPDRIWVTKTSGWGGIERGGYQNSSFEGGVQYLASTPAREHAEELLKLVADQLEAMTKFGIQGGGVTAARDLIAKIEGKANE
jgi:hypothetical protein